MFSAPIRWFFAVSLGVAVWTAVCQGSESRIPDGTPSVKVQPAETVRPERYQDYEHYYRPPPNSAMRQYGYRPSYVWPPGYAYYPRPRYGYPGYYGYYDYPGYYRVFPYTVPPSPYPFSYYPYWYRGYVF